MSKKILTIIIIIFLLIIAGIAGGYFYLTNTKTTDAPELVEGAGSLAENTAPVVEQSTNGSFGTSSPGLLPRLRHITTTPVAGYDFVSKTQGYSVWYVDRATGNVFETATSTTDVTRITNTTIPKVYEAYIGQGGSHVVLRTLNENSDSIQTFIGTPKVKSSTSTSTDTTMELTGIFTGDTISHLSLSPLKNSFFGITGNSSAIGNIYSWGAKTTNTFSHSLRNWVPNWVSSNTILMTSSPSAKTQNIAYFLNTSTKAFTKLLGPKNGLVVSSSPDLTHILFSENKSNKLVFGAYNTKTGLETNITAGTIPDKCDWSSVDTSVAYCGFPKNIPDGAYPDDWYQGKTTFNDVIKSFDAETFQFQTIADLESLSGTQIDILDIKLSSDGKYLLFTNKNDLTLWMLEIAG